MTERFCGLTLSLAGVSVTVAGFTAMVTVGGVPAESAAGAKATRPHVDGGKGAEVAPPSDVLEPPFPPPIDCVVPDTVFATVSTTIPLNDVQPVLLLPRMTMSPDMTQSGSVGASYFSLMVTGWANVSAVVPIW